MTTTRRRILVTGGSGFIGRHLVARMAEHHDVHVLARREPEGMDGVTWVPADLARPLDRAVLPGRVDAVFHLAQSRFYRDFPEHATDIFEVNIRSTFELLEYARRAGASRFVFASSGGVYGSGYERLMEDAPVNLLNFYLSSKYTGEVLLGNYRPFFETVVFRFFFVYGPGQREMLVPTLMRKVAEGEEIVIQGDPGLRINPIFVEDAVRVFEPALELEGSDLFNVSGDQSVTITELVRLIEGVIGREANIRYVDTGQPGDLVGDNGLMKDVLGVTPEVTLDQGLRRVAESLPHTVTGA